MGFDMHICGVEPTTIAEPPDGFDVFTDDLPEDYSPDWLHNDIEDLYECFAARANDGYFRANISVMPRLRFEMSKYGMLNDAPKRDDDPDPGYFSHWEPQPVRGIPTYKLSSNDGQSVTAAEIRSALEAYDSRPYDDATPYTPMPDDPDETFRRTLADIVPEGAIQRTPCPDDDEMREVWKAWLYYLRLAADNGGFTVT